MCQCLTHSNPYCSSYSVKGTVVKKIFILNKSIVHLINDIFWHMGFKTETQAEKVILIIRFIEFYNNYYTYYTYANYKHYCRLRQDLGLADHVWQDKRAAIAETVDDLGDQFRPAMRAGWLSYIRQAYVVH